MLFIALQLCSLQPTVASDKYVNQAIKVAVKIYVKRKAKDSTLSPYIFVIDFDQPSTSKRAYIITKTGNIIYQGYVAHGANSGDLYATRFSNQPESLKSSLGAYKTAGIYYGKHGRSLRVQGLESGYNSNAYTRAIVIHSATYATEAYISNNGQLGRSWGCFAVSPNDIGYIINTLKSNSLVVAYSRSGSWLIKQHLN